MTARRASPRSAASGGGEIRTPVLHKIFCSVYARIPSIDVSARWPTGRPRANEPTGISPVGGRRTVGPARICDTGPPPRAGCRSGTAGVRLGLTRRERSQNSQLYSSRVFYQGPEDLGAQPRSHLHNRNQSPPLLRGDDTPTGGNVQRGARRRSGAGARQAPRPTSRIRLAATAAPKPLSMLQTVTPAAQELSIVRSGASPPKAAP